MFPDLNIWSKKQVNKTKNLTRHSMSTFNAGQSVILATHTFGSVFKIDCGPVPGPINNKVEILPGPELEAGRACRAISGCPEPCWWWPCTCCAWGFGTDMPCWALPSGDEVGTSKDCWEGVEVGGKCRGLIFSAISCSLILLMSTRLSSWKG